MLDNFLGNFDNSYYTI